MAYGATLRISEDRGESWTQVVSGPCYARESGFALKRIWQIAPGAPSEPETLYAGVDEAGLFVSRDGGATWRLVEGLARHPSRPYWRPGGGGLCLHSILVDPGEPRRLWVGVSAVGVFRSDDGGESWRTCSQGLVGATEGASPAGIGYAVRKLVMHPHDPTALYLWARGGVYRSADGGDSWSPHNAGLPAEFGFGLAIARTGELYAVPLDPETRCFPEGKPRVYRLPEGGARWQALDGGLPGVPFFTGVLRDGLAVDSLQPAGVYFGTTQGDVFFSRDAGEHWERLPGQFSRVISVKAWVLDDGSREKE
jgi:hypothetical protein